MANDKASRREYMRLYSATHREKFREYNRKAYAKNVGVERAAKAAWKRNNAEKNRAINRAWNQANKPLRASYAAAYRAKVLLATPRWAEYDAMSIVYSKAAELGLHVDHVVPLKSDVVCGLHVHANLQLLDKSLNSSKNNRSWPDMPC